MVVILITVLAQNNMPSKCFITFLNTTAQTERSDSNHSLQSPCLRSSQTSLLRRKVASYEARCTSLLIPSLFVHAEHEEPQHYRFLAEDARGQIVGRQMVCERW